MCTNSTAPSVSSINRILRNRAAERAAAEFARNYQIAAAATAVHYQPQPPQTATAAAAAAPVGTNGLLAANTSSVINPLFASATNPLYAAWITATAFGTNSKPGNLTGEHSMISSGYSLDNGLNKLSSERLSQFLPTPSQQQIHQMLAIAAAANMAKPDKHKKTLWNPSKEKQEEEKQEKNISMNKTKKGKMKYY